MNKYPYNERRGFTLVELLVVIAVVAILVTIGIVGYGSWRTSVASAQIKSDLNAVASAMEDARTFGDGYPSALPATVTTSDDVEIALYSTTADSYCVDGNNVDNTDLAFYVASETKDQGAIAGTCATREATTVPGMPTDLAVTSIGSSTINLSWTGVSGVVSQYTIQCAEDAGFVYNLRQSTSSTTTGSVTGASANTTQFCRVKATNSAGDGAWSSVINGNTVQLAPPTNLAVIDTGSFAIDLAWDINADANTYSLACATNTSFSTGLVTTSVSAPLLTGTVSGLLSGTTYYCRVNTVATSGTSSWSPYVTAITEVIPAPNDLISTSQTTTSVSWSFSAIPGAASYDVQLATDAAFTSLVGSANITTTTPTSTGLNPGVRYYYRVRSVPASGPASSWSSGTDAVTTMTGVSGFAVAAGKTTSTVTLSWSNNSAAASYVLQRATDSNFTQNVSGSAPHVGTSFTFSGLTHNTTYYFRIYATGTAGTNSAWTSPASTTTYTYIMDQGGSAYSPSDYALMSANNQYRLSVQSDGNLVVYRMSDNYAMWSRGASPGNDSYRLSMQTDGNLVLYNNTSGLWLWQTYTNNTVIPTNGYYVVLGDDGNLIIADATKAIWSWMTGKIAPPCTEIQNETFRIMTRHSNKALDVEAASGSNGAKIQQYDYLGYNNQRWVVTHLGNSQYRLSPLHITSKTLDLNGPSLSDGTVVHQWDWLDTSNQKWYLRPTSNGYCNIESVYSGKAVEVGGASTANGAQVNQWGYTPPGTNHQQWIFLMP